MLKFTKNQIHGPIMGDRHLLLEDVVNHFLKDLPEVVNAYPKGYFLSIVNESIDIALKHKMDDVFTVRLFVRLRWEIAPGFYKHPQIASVLKQTSRPAQDRFDELTTPTFDKAWEEAQSLTGPDEWRGDAWSSGE